MAVVLAAIVLLALRWFVWQSFAPEKVSAIMRSCRPRRVRMSKSVLLLMLAIYAFVCIAIVHFATSFEDYGQSDVSVLRLNLAIRYHLRPFLDIQWNYGPLLFYVPLVAMKLVCASGGNANRLRHRIHHSSVRSLLVLFYFIDHLYIKVAYRILLFCLFSLFWFDMSLAVQGVSLPFAPFSHYWSASIFPKLGPAKSLRSILCLAGICVACNLAVLSIGVEVGIPHAIVQIVYCIHAALAVTAQTLRRRGHPSQRAFVRGAVPGSARC